MTPNESLDFGLWFWRTVLTGAFGILFWPIMVLCVLHLVFVSLRAIGDRMAARRIEADRQEFQRTLVERRIAAGYPPEGWQMPGDWGQSFEERNRK